MALTLEELYARRANQRQAQRGLLNSPMGSRRGMAGMGGSAMRSIPSMAESQTVIPSDMPDIEMGGGAMPRETYRQMMEGRRRGGGLPPRVQPPAMAMGGPGADTEAMLDGNLTVNPEVIDMMQGNVDPTETASVRPTGLPSREQVQDALNRANSETAANNLLNTVVAGRSGGGLLASNVPLTDGVEYDALADTEPVAASTPSTASTLFNNLGNTVTSFTSTPAAVDATVDSAADADPNAQVVDTSDATATGSETAASDLLNTVTNVTDPAVDASVNADATTPSTNQPAAAEDTGAAGVTNAALLSQVNGLYNTYLGRNGDPANMQYWADQLAAGVPFADIENAIANSPEGIAYAAAQQDGGAGDTEGTDATTPTDFDEGAATSEIISAYQTLLGRSPKSEGLNYWLGTMRDGASLAEVINNIRQSPEFGGRVMGSVQQMFQRYLERGATEAEVNNYLQQAQSGVPLEQIEAEIAALAPDQETNPDTGVPTAPAPSATPVGSQADVQTAIDETQTYDAETAAPSGTAEAVSTVVPTRTVQPEETAQYQLNQILDPNSPLMQRARTQGMQFANQRGLLNSSLAAQAAQTAMLDSAVPLAQQDARTFAEAAGQITDIEGRAGLQDAALGTDVSKFNVSETNVTNRFNAESLNQAGAFNANAANTSIQNFLERESRRLLQDDAQLFTAEQNQADRELRNYLQERQFDFQGSENALDRELQEKLQQNDQAFRSSEAQLDRNFQSTERALDRSLQTSEAALDRSLSQLLSNDRIAFETWSQENAQTWNAAQNALQREFDRYRVDAQTASTVMFSTMESIAQIYADPNLNATQKQAAIQNVMDLATSTPALVSQITAGMNRDTQNTLPDGVDATAYTDPEALLGDAFDPEANYWIGPFGSQYGASHHPTWIIPPEAGAEVSQGIELLTNPETGQIYIAPTGGYRLRGADDDFTDTGGGDSGLPDGVPNGYTPFINPQTGLQTGNLFNGPDGRLYRWNPETQEMVLVDTSGATGGGGR